MATDPSSLAEVPPVARAFMRQHRIAADAVRAGGRVVLTIDQRWRVHLVPAPHNRLAIQAELLELPPHDRRCAAVLMHLARKGSGLLQSHGSTLCIDASRHTLSLQQSVPSNAELKTLQDALGEFANALGFWMPLCRAEAALLKGERP